jgi:hypothetical protein
MLCVMMGTRMTIHLNVFSCKCYNVLKGPYNPLIVTLFPSTMLLTDIHWPTLRQLDRNLVCIMMFIAQYLLNYCQYVFRRVAAYMQIHNILNTNNRYDFV